MDKLLLIAGPTASGKTSLGLHLANKFNGEIISADSRQVYRGMDIGTGKDVEEIKNQKSKIKIDDKEFTVYEDSGIKIWGYDLVNFDQEFSVAQFVRAAKYAIKDIESRGKLPILVGGTGLYLKSLLNPPKSLNVKPNPALRTKLEKLSLEQLQQRLQKLNLQRFQSMNHSDQLNPRRLIRTIEIASSSESLTKSPAPTLDSLWIGLQPPLRTTDKNIEKRVHQRLDQGFEQEVEDLMGQGFNPRLPSATSTGYRQYFQYQNDEITRPEFIDLWITAEKQYARRQLTWFKKQKNIHWFDPTTPQFKSQVERRVEDW